MIGSRDEQGAFVMYQDWVERGEALIFRLKDYDFRGLWLQISAEPAYLAAAVVAILAVFVLSRSLLLAIAIACIAPILLSAFIGVAVPQEATIGLSGVASLAILVGGWSCRRRYRREVARCQAAVEDRALVQEKLDDEIRWRMAAEATTPKAAGDALPEGASPNRE
ncbi:hypothetical protein [Hoeflea ulvae]|uniref:Uncharacterized protein n=1 Tax=Hoeflea ulvae TaxID=2983764 RepID=A0ABT3YML3_9HYPH|nr:hypothetical protein [Hoeflea ulvae]MCY0097077.1 hypothetical protein [Hoeflea ulvae]